MTDQPSVSQSTQREPQPLGAAELRTELSRQIDTAGGATAFASRHHISRAYLQDVLDAATPPGPLILEAIGYRQVTRYEKASAP